MSENTNILEMLLKTVQECIFEKEQHFIQLKKIFLD